jgi:hypothetical protein
MDRSASPDPEPRPFEHGWILPRQCGSFDAGLSCPQVFGHADPTPAGTTGRAQVGERVFTSSNGQRVLIAEHTGASVVSVHPPSDLLQSYAHSLARSDLDQDGVPELLTGLGEPLGYGVLGVELHPEPTSLGVERLGYVVDVRPVQTPQGPRALAVVSGDRPSRALFGDDTPPSQVVVLGLQDDAWVVHQRLVLPDYVHAVHHAVFADVDGDGWMDVVLAADRAPIPGRFGSRLSVFVLQDGSGHVELVGSVPELNVLAAAQIDHDPEWELGGVFAGRDVLFGVGEPLQPTARPQGVGPEDGALLESLGQYAEAALALEEQGDHAGAQALWVQAHDYERASLSAERSGDLPVAAQLAGLALDFERATRLGAEGWPAGVPEVQLDLGVPLDPQVWTHPDAVTPDRVRGTLELHSAGAAMPLVHLDLRATREPVAVDLGLDWTHATWGSGLLVQLLDEHGAPVARLDLGAGGSGGDFGRFVKAPFHAPLGVEEGALAWIWSPRRAGVLHDGAWLNRVDQDAHIDAGQALSLRIQGGPSAGPSLRAELTHLAIWGLTLRDAQPHVVLVDDGVASARVAGRPPDSGAAFAQTWSSTAVWHPDDPALQRALAAWTDWGDVPATARATLLVTRGREAWRRGDQAGAQADLLHALNVVDQEPRAWTSGVAAHALLAEIERALGGDPQPHLDQAVLLAPDPDLGERLLDNR